MDARQKADLDRHITGNYGENQFSDEESGRPRIDAPSHEHRRWFSEQLDKLMNRRVKVLQTYSEGDLEMWKVEVQNLNAIHEVLVQAYMDGHAAERKVKDFLGE